MRRRVPQLLTALLLLALTAGCFGGDDSEATRGIEALAAALSKPDAQALRALVEDERSSATTALLTDEIVAENAFAGKEIDIDADIDRFNGYGTYVLTSEEAPGVQVRASQDLDQPGAEGALDDVRLSSDQSLSTILVNDHPVELEASGTSSRQEARYTMPPGTWTFSLPPHPYADSEPQTIELTKVSSRDSVFLSSTLNEAGRTEAIRQADAYVAACEKPTKNPQTDCGGAMSVCAGEETTRTITFSERPKWTVGGSAGTEISHQGGLKRTVETVCTDRETGQVSERTRETGPAQMQTVIAITPTGVDPQFS